MTTANTMRPVNVGLIGAGAIARAHAIAYAMAQRYGGNDVAPARLRLLAETDATRAKEACERLGFESWTADWRELVGSDDVDLVSIVTPNFLHAEMAVAAAEAGKHVFCEKPLASSVGGAERMWRAAETAGIVHGVNLTYRKVPAIRFLARLVAEGGIGPIRHFRASYLQDWANDPRIPRSWKFDAGLSGGGAVSGVGTHVIDLARMLVGEIERISATTEIWIRERPLPASASTFERVEGAREIAAVDNDDSAYFLARFANGAIGAFDISRCALGRKNHLSLEIHGERGSIVYDYEQPNEVRLYDGSDDATVSGFRTILIGPAQDSSALLAYPGIPVGFVDTMALQVRDMLSAIAGGPPMTPDFFDGWRAQVVVEAVVACTDRGWIDLPVALRPATGKAEG